MTLPEIRDQLAEARRYVRSDRVEAERLMREPMEVMTRLTESTFIDEYDKSLFWMRLAENLNASIGALIVEPDTAAGGIDLVRFEIALAIGRPTE